MCLVDQRNGHRRVCVIVTMVDRIDCGNPSSVNSFVVSRDCFYYFHSLTTRSGGRVNGQTGKRADRRTHDPNSNFENHVMTQNLEAGAQKQQREQEIIQDVVWQSAAFFGSSPTLRTTRGTSVFRPPFNHSEQLASEDSNARYLPVSIVYWVLVQIGNTETNKHSLIISRQDVILNFCNATAKVDLVFFVC
jgi:hypothetical protein